MSEKYKTPAIMLTKEWKTASNLEEKGLFYAAKANLYSGYYGDCEYLFINKEHAKKTALECFNKSIEICRHSSFYSSRAAFFYHSAEYMKCIRDCNEILSEEESEHLGDAYETRAMAKNKLGDLRGALDDYKKTLDVSTHRELYSCHYEQMAEIKLKLNDLKGVIEDYKNAVDYCSLEDKYEDDNYNKKRLLMILANLKFQNGDKIGACKCWSEAGELGKEEAYHYIRNNCN